MNNKFSENLKKIRKENNLSQEQLADELGVSRQAISKWESASAYPEMDKIIALCDKFNLNIDDLLHRDIKEVKGEEESKKNINNYIDGFLNFITDTINMFSRMKFKSKIKCIIEQLIIIGLLTGASAIGIAIFDSIFERLFMAFLPDKIALVFSNVMYYILNLLFLIVCAVIVIHVFKIRYLDYYKKETKKKEIIKEDNNEEDKTVEEYSEDKKEKIELKNDENRIIIRDPKHSEYGFIKGFLKVIVYFIKFIVFWIAFGFACTLIALFIGFVLSFLIVKTGLFFVGLLVSILAAAVINLIILLLLINFIFNRKNDKKKMIWSFLISIIALGIGIGIMCLGTLNFKVYEDDAEMVETKTSTYKMNDNFTIFNYYSEEINYIESDNNDIKVEYKINKACNIHEYNTNDSLIEINAECDEPIKVVKEFVDNLNNKKIIPISHMIYEINVYSNKKNISIIKKNIQKEEARRKEIEEREYGYEKQIRDMEEMNDKLYSENEELKERIRELEEKIAIEE